MGRGGRRPGAGRPRKNQEANSVKETKFKKDVQSILLSEDCNETVKKMAHKMVFIEHELEFLKKIISAETKKR